MTKKLILILFFYLIHYSSFSQTNNAALPRFNYHHDFSNILSSTQDDNNENFYNRLLNRFLAADPTMTNAQTLALMIGFTDKPAFKPLENMITEKEIVELVQNGNFREAVDVSKKLLKTNPLNLMALQQITIAYNNLKIKDSAKYYMKLHVKIMDAMIYSGNGKSPETAIFSLGLADGEYFTKNVGYDIINKDADWNRRGDFMEIIKASDQEAVNRMFYFVIQHAKLKMDDDKANSDAFNKKLKDSLDKKNKDDKKLAKSKSKIKNKISTDSLTQQPNDSSQINVNLHDSTSSITDSNSITKTTDNSTSGKVNNKRKSETKKKETEINSSPLIKNIADAGLAIKTDTMNIANAQSDKNIHNKKSKKEKKNAVVVKNDNDSIVNSNVDQPLHDSNVNATSLINDSLKNDPPINFDSTKHINNLNIPSQRDSISLSDSLTDTSNINIQQTDTAFNTPSPYTNTSTIDSTLNKIQNNSLSIVDSSVVITNQDSTFERVTQSIKLNVDSSAKNIQQEITTPIDSGNIKLQQDSSVKKTNESIFTNTDSVKNSTTAIDSSVNSIQQKITTPIDSGSIKLQQDSAVKKINESIIPNTDSVKNSTAAIDSSAIIVQPINNVISDSANNIDAIQKIDKEIKSDTIKNMHDTISDIKEVDFTPIQDSLKNKIQLDSIKELNQPIENTQPANDDKPLKNNNETDTTPADNTIRKNR